MEIKLGIVDDHLLFTKSLSLLLNSFENFSVIIDATNGKEFQEKLNEASSVPDIVLIDVNMPIMNGIETATWLKQKYPQIKAVALSTDDNDRSLIGMIKAGCCAYLIKETSPDNLKKAINMIFTTGFYNADSLHNNLSRVISRKINAEISEKEISFIKYCATDLTYKEIAAKLEISPKTIDVWRDNLFQKLNVQSRVGLVMEALRQNLIDL